MVSERHPLAPLEYVLGAYGLLYFLFDDAGNHLDYRSGDPSELFAAPEAFLGRNVKDVLPEAAAIPLLACISRVAARGVPETYEYELPFPEGPRHYEARIVPAGPGRIAAFTRNVTEQRRAERTLRAENAFRESIIANAADGICVCHAIGEHPFIRFTVWNGRMTEITGYTIEEINAKGWYQSLYPDPEVQARAVARMDRMREGDNLLGEEWEIRHRDGTVRQVVISTSVVGGAPGPSGVLAMMRDVTDRRRLEERLLQTQKLESIGRLAGGVAHDFNNLLTAILGYAELLEVELPPGSRGRGWLDEVRRGSERARDLTRQLLAFARRQRIAPRPTDLNALAAGLRNLLSRLLGERIVLETRLPERIAPVLADPAQIEQVVMNLSLNARDAMPRGGTLTIATREVPESERPEGRFVELSVRDTGTGMSPDTLEHLFEPFFTTKDVGEGTGLGLATVYGIVRQSGGLIEVESEPGAGTVFRILLPRADAAITEPARREARSPQGGSETILVVEDDPSVRGWTVESLRTAGYHVVEASDGEGALAIVARVRPDALVTDVVMPRLGGPELARRLRETRPDLPVLLVSGYAPGAESRFVDRAAFLQKPFTRAKLLDTLRRILDA
jgi:PAS domain S-box-containing protein